MSDWVRDDAVFCGMMSGRVSRCRWKWRRLRGECCVQRKHQVQNPCARTCKWKHLERVLLTFKMQAASWARPSPRLQSPESCWPCFRLVHPLRTSLLSAWPSLSPPLPGTTVVTSWLAFLLPLDQRQTVLRPENWKPTHGRLTLSRNSSLLLLTSQTSPSCVDESTMTQSLPTSPAHSRTFLRSPSQPPSLLLPLGPTGCFSRLEASTLIPSSSWLAQSPALDWEGSF